LQFEIDRVNGENSNMDELFNLKQITQEWIDKAQGDFAGA
jgi:hypothetical protein